MSHIEKGQIVWVKLEGVGSEQAGLRPSVILQNDIGNRFASTTIIAPLTTRKIGKRLPTQLRVQGSEIGDDFQDSTILLEQIKVIDKSRIVKVCNKLPSAIVEKINNKIMLSLDIMVT